MLKTKHNKNNKGSFGTMDKGKLITELNLKRIYFKQDKIAI